MGDPIVGRPADTVAVDATVKFSVKELFANLERSFQESMQAVLVKLGNIEDTLRNKVDVEVFSKLDARVQTLELKAQADDLIQVFRIKRWKIVGSVLGGASAAAIVLGYLASVHVLK